MRATIASCLALFACSGRGHDAEHAAAKDELPGQSVTVWTDHHELFMEYRPLLVGHDIGFAAHVTVIPTFKALDAGTVTVAVKMKAGGEVTGAADKADPPGIFRPIARPAQAGPCQLVVTIVHGGPPDVLDAGPCEVFADAATAAKALGEEEETPGQITFLKEQQWKTEFATAPVAKRPLQPGVRAAGEIRPVAGKEARLIAPAAGRVTLADQVPVLGTSVTKGQVLATVAPRLAVGGDRSSLDADLETARAGLEAAQQQLRRAERLLADQAIPEKQVEEARTAERVARARVSAASGRLGQYTAGASGGGGGGRGGMQVRSPIEGTLVAMNVASGQSIAEGDVLFTVVDLDQVWLQVEVFEPDIARVEHATEAWFTLEGYDQPFHVDATNGKVITLGRMLDPATRTVPLIFEIANTEGRLRIGQFAKVTVASGAPVEALAIPESAIVEDAGKPVAYVEVEGEAFARRPLTLGPRAGGWVEVVDGLAEGEHVVTVGAYEIKLASSGGSIPAHGHAH